jgi:hypothetical protein
MLAKPSNIVPGLKAAFSARQPFNHFALNLSPQAVQVFENLRIDKAGFYNNFGADGVVHADTVRFVSELGNSHATATLAADVVYDLAQSVYEAMGAETSWLTLRASHPNTNFDIPRWHQDGLFFDFDAPGEQHKVAFALKGATTFFAHVNGNDRREFNLIARRASITDAAERRLAIAKFVKTLRTEMTPVGHGSVFEVGSETRSGVHSEPPIHASRLFMSLLPGTSAQIAQLRQEWKAPLTMFKL